MCCYQDEKKEKDSCAYTDQAKQNLQKPADGRNGYQPHGTSNQDPGKQDHE